MSARSPFVSRNTPPIPEAFPESATARRRQQEKEQGQEDEMEIDDMPNGLPLPLDSRIIPLGWPEAQDATARGRQVEKEEGKGKDKRPDSPHFSLGSGTMEFKIPAPKDSTARGKQKENETSNPSPNSYMRHRRQNAVHDVTMTSSSVEDTTMTDIIPVLKDNPYDNWKPNFEREMLCVKAGEMVWNDLSQPLIWPMGGINLNDEAMCERVTDLVVFHVPMSVIFAVLTVSAWTRPRACSPKGQARASIYGKYL